MGFLKVGPGCLFHPGAEADETEEGADAGFKKYLELKKKPGK